MAIIKSPCDHCKKVFKDVFSLGNGKRTLHFCEDCFKTWFELRDEVVEEALRKFVK